MQSLKMILETKYGIFVLKETLTGLIAKQLKTGNEYVIDGRWLPDLDCTMDVALTIQAIEDEFDFQKLNK